MSDFFMYLERLSRNHLEYTALNAITRMIAERVGYVVKPRFLQAPTQWQLLTPQGGQIVFKSKGTDVDAAWSAARLKKLIPEYALSVDAAMTLVIPYQTDDNECTVKLEWKHWGEWEFTIGNGYDIYAVRNSRNPVHAIIAAYWDVETRETSETSAS